VVLRQCSIGGGAGDDGLSGPTNHTIDLILLS
jgi:hypothetical protein